MIESQNVWITHIQPGAHETQTNHAFSYSFFSSPLHFAARLFQLDSRAQNFLGIPRPCGRRGGGEYGELLLYTRGASCTPFDLHYTYASYSSLRQCINPIPRAQLINPADKPYCLHYTTDSPEKFNFLIEYIRHNFIHKISWLVWYIIFKLIFYIYSKYVYRLTLYYIRECENIEYNVRV